MDLKFELRKRQAIINEALKRYLEFEYNCKLYEAMRHLPLAGGKRLRPIIAMLAGDAVSGQGEKTIPFGISLELIHNFTLLHDDLMDKDDFRRGVPTVHKLYDDATAIIAGDALYARAFEVLSELDCKPDVLREIVREVGAMTRLISEGQQSDMDFEKRAEIKEEEYLRMIEQKTALIYQTAAKGGAMIADGSEDVVKNLAEYGRLIGIGFQMWDDYLDLKGNEEKLGKPVGSDIRKGKRTLIIVHALEHCSSSEKEVLSKILGSRDASDDDLKMAIEILEGTGSIDYVRDMALNFAERAKRLLEVLEDSESKEILSEIAVYMVRRES